MKRCRSGAASPDLRIGRRIDAMQSVTGRSVTAIATITETLRELNSFSARIADAADQRAAAAREIATNAKVAVASVRDVNDAINEIEGVVAEAAQSTDRVATAATDLTSQARRIREQMSGLSGRMRAIYA